MTEKKHKKEKLDVSQAFAELEAITAWFEKGETDLELGLKKYEQAMELAKALQLKLEQAENKINEIQNLNK
ncbi:MAG TPA: exodeoxyribonuclease VII small subunit [bacterium]|nr:MAG: exodeoxyribonuclease VII small subunit [Parcubacteria group bacterium ADurb.Bin192]HPN15268.1 exodeoxyribonuclease VII small subunit [bacterium]